MVLRQKGINMKDRIKLIRKEASLNQTEFGEKIGATTSAVSGWELGTRTPTEISIKAICREFNVNYPWLVDGIGEMHPEMNDVEAYCKSKNITDPTLIHIVETFFSLDDKEQEYLGSLIRKFAGKE